MSVVTPHPTWAERAIIVRIMVGAGYVAGILKGPAQSDWGDILVSPLLLPATQYWVRGRKFGHALQ